MFDPIRPEDTLQRALSRRRFLSQITQSEGLALRAENLAKARLFQPVTNEKYGGNRRDSELSKGKAYWFSHR